MCALFGQTEIEDKTSIHCDWDMTAIKTTALMPVLSCPYLPRMLQSGRNKLYVSNTADFSGVLLRSFKAPCTLIIHTSLATLFPAAER